ncbi:MAG: efflux RND transporter periplasmic adaptor subunit [Vicinamibacterales bacterium]
MGVEVVTMAPSAIEEFTEFIGTVKSRRSVTVQPQVEGFVTRIAVSSGARVAPGAVLMEIDAGRQEAAVATLEAQRAAREADLAFWRQQVGRLGTLLEAGAVSQQEHDQAASTLKAGEAQLAAIDQQIREQRVELGYHRVLAPTAGVVGDIPVRVGDRVTRSTLLTTVDDNQSLEVYLPVPVQQARTCASGCRCGSWTTAARRPGRPSSPSSRRRWIRRPSRCWPRRRSTGPTACATTSTCGRASSGANARASRPLVAVTRVNGRYFAFVAEKGGEGTVARQRAIDVGPLVGNDYVVLGGLAAGEQLIVSGVQKIGDGMPVSARPAGVAEPAAPAAAAAAGK